MTIGEQIQKLRIRKGLTQDRLAEMLEVSTDTILLNSAEEQEESKNPLHLGCIYLVVKDFEKSVEFYEKFYDQKAEDYCRSGNKFVKFYIDDKCIALMNEDNIIGHCTNMNSPYKFVQNYWVEELMTEYERIKGLNISYVTEIREAYPICYYFHLTDPDNNIIEITGDYFMTNDICQSCAIPMTANDHGTNSDGSTKATPHKERLTALHVICLHIFRHLARKLLDIRQYACVVFIQSDVVSPVTGEVSA